MNQRSSSGSSSPTTNAYARAFPSSFTMGYRFEPQKLDEAYAEAFRSFLQSFLVDRSFDLDELNNVYAEAFLSWSPAGFHLDPEDHELISFYLKPKVYKQVPPPLIHEVNLYDNDPEFLAATYRPQGKEKWYFFTPRDRKYKNGCRPNRQAANGYWKATMGDTNIVDTRKNIVGYKKTLVFHRGKPPNGGCKTNWIMHEYRLKDAPKIDRTQNEMKLDDWVLCRIYKKKATGSGSNSSQPQVVDEPVLQGGDNAAGTTLTTRIRANDNLYPHPLGVRNEAADGHGGYQREQSSPLSIRMGIQYFGQATSSSANWFDHDHDSHRQHAQVDFFHESDPIHQNGESSSSDLLNIQYDIDDDYGGLLGMPPPVLLLQEQQPSLDDQLNMTNTRRDNP
ncbi:hypothetical protein Ancab_003989 [Ancistrocladus abbreviatus]